jgi:preprotein translocase subunit SecE
MTAQKGLMYFKSAPKAVYGFILEARDELKKVSWPSRETTLRYTIIVVIASIMVGALTGGIDYLLTLILEQVV